MAQDTLSIIESGRYRAPGGAEIDISRELRAAISGTVLYRPRDLEPESVCASGGSPVVEVTDETTQVAARRLVQDQGVPELVLLNFASARNAGGGFLGGAKAQEEDICRCSGLYACLLTQPAYYEANRAQSSMLYTDHIIYSPRVPFFRDRSPDLLETPFLASVITAPAPNAGEHLRRGPGDERTLLEVLHRRAGKVLAVARDRRHRHLLLGAWGCGVFRNDPRRVADAFGAWIAHLSAAFDRIVFAVPAGKGGNHEAFRARFG